MKYKFKLKHLVLAVLVVKAVLYGGAKPAGTNAPPQVVGLVQGGSAVSALVEDGSSASLTSGEDAASPLSGAPSGGSRVGYAKTSLAELS